MRSSRNSNRPLPWLLLFLSLFAGVLFPVISQGQALKTASIQGKVFTSDGQPAEGATVVLNNILSIAVSKEGGYIFNNLAAGEYQVAVSFAGQEPQQKATIVTAGEAATVDFSLTVSAKKLNEVIVVGSKYTIASRKKSSTASRLPLGYLENPQIYSVVDKELISEQMALTLEESFRNVPGAAPAKTGAGMPAFVSRGFYTTENLRNGMATYLRTGIDLASVERVEAIKGPSSTLFGGTLVSLGGLVNYITKKPYTNFGGELSYTTGSFGMNRLTADINAPVNEEKTALFRINLAAQNKNDWQDQGHGSTLVVAPSFSYKVNDQLTFRIDADLQQYKGTSNTAWTVASGVTARSFDELKLDYKRSLIDNSFIGKQRSMNVFASAEYKISDQWISQTSFSWGSGEYNDLNYFYQTWLTDTTIQRRIDVFSPDKTGRTHFQQNFTGDFRIGSLRNRLVVGIDYMNQYRNYKYNGVVMDTVNINSTTVRDLRVQLLEDKLAALTAPPMHQELNTYGAYFSDVLNLTPTLMVMASLRVDHLENKGTKNRLSLVEPVTYSQTALSPKFGIVYQPIKDRIAIFTNYMNGFTNQGDSPPQTDGKVVAGKPRYANQFEAGVKLDVLQNKLSATASYYTISVRDALRLETVGGNTFYYFDGTQQSKGVELEVIGNPVPGLNFVTGYGYNDNEYEKANAGLAGKRNIGTPKHVGNFWASYTLLGGELKGFGIGAGAMYASESFVNNTNTVVMPSYLTVDATVFYNHPKFRMGVKAGNITNEHYWVSDAFYSHPQATRSFLATLAFRF